jgi:putative transposase
MEVRHEEEEVFGRTDRVDTEASTSGAACGRLIRQVGISEQTFYRWKRQYPGLKSDQVREFKQLAEENGRLKKLVAALSLDKAVLQDVLSKNSPARAHETGCCLPDGVARL